MAATKNLENFESGGAVTCTMTSLANGSARDSAVIDNSANLFLDDAITCTFTIISGSPSTSGASVNFYVAASPDGTLFPKVQLATGATYQTGAGDAATGALGSPNNLRLIGTFGLQSTTSAGERTFTTEPMSIMQALGYLPKKYSIVVENGTGVAFSASTTTTATNLNHSPLTTTSGN
jgi:hypothetical protein